MVTGRAINERYYHRHVQEKISLSIDSGTRQISFRRFNKGFRSKLFWWLNRLTDSWWRPGWIIPETLKYEDICFPLKQCKRVSIFYAIVSLTLSSLLSPLRCSRFHWEILLKLSPQTAHTHLAVHVLWLHVTLADIIETNIGSFLCSLVRGHLPVWNPMRIDQSAETVFVEWRDFSLVSYKWITNQILSVSCIGNTMDTLIIYLSIWPAKVRDRTKPSARDSSNSLLHTSDQSTVPTYDLYCKLITEKTLFPRIIF